MERGVERELGQQDRGKLLRGASGQSGRRVIAHKEARRHREIADDRAVIIHKDVGTCALAGRRPGMAASPSFAQAVLAPRELRRLPRRRGKGALASDTRRRASPRPRRPLLAWRAHPPRHGPALPCSSRARGRGCRRYGARRLERWTRARALHPSAGAELAHAVQHRLDRSWSSHGCVESQSLERNMQLVGPDSLIGAVAEDL